MHCKNKNWRNAYYCNAYDLPHVSITCDTHGECVHVHEQDPAWEQWAEAKDRGKAQYCPQPGQRSWASVSEAVALGSAGHWHREVGNVVSLIQATGAYKTSCSSAINSMCTVPLFYYGAVKVVAPTWGWWASQGKGKWWEGISESFAVNAWPEQLRNIEKIAQEYQSLTLSHSTHTARSCCTFLFYFFSSDISLLLTRLPSPGFLQPPVAVWPEL